MPKCTTKWYYHLQQFSSTKVPNMIAIDGMVKPGSFFTWPCNTDKASAHTSYEWTIYLTLPPSKLALRRITLFTPTTKKQTQAE